MPLTPKKAPKISIWGGVPPPEPLGGTLPPKILPWQFLQPPKTDFQKRIILAIYKVKTEPIQDVRGLRVYREKRAFMKRNAFWLRKLKNTRFVPHRVPPMRYRSCIRVFRSQKNQTQRRWLCFWAFIEALFRWKDFGWVFLLNYLLIGNQKPRPQSGPPGKKWVFKGWKSKILWDFGPFFEEPAHNGFQKGDNWVGF